MRLSIPFIITALIAIFSLPAIGTAQQQQPSVLAELFCNINCIGCPVPDSAYDHYVSTHPAVAVLKYHNITTDEHDPFFVASVNLGEKDRDQFYGGSNGLSDPTAYIDGLYPNTGSESDWETYSNLASGVATMINPSLSYGPNGVATITFTVTGSLATQVNAYVAIKQSQIYFVNSSGNYGRTPGDLWNDIFRVMLVPAGGTNFNFSGSHTFSVVFDSSQYSDLFSSDLKNMAAVVFVQDVNPASGATNNSHQVEAVGEVSLAPPAAVSETSASSDQLILPENPLPSSGSFHFSLAKAGDVQIGIYDLLGREVRTLVSGTMPSGETTVDMNGTTLPTGVYVARMIVDGRTVDQKKFVTR